MKIKVAELTGTSLDWAVGACEGHSLIFRPYAHRPGGLLYLHGGATLPYEPSAHWDQGGPILVRAIDNHESRETVDFRTIFGDIDTFPYGPILLIAAMRCYVIGKMGDEVDVPDEIAA